jgi:hypothetical protein
MVGMGRMMGGGANTNEMMAKLGIETGKLNAEFEHLQLPINDMLKSLQEMFRPLSAALVGGSLGGPLPTGQHIPGMQGSTFRQGVMLSLIVRFAYVAVLKEAIDKAVSASTKVFNLETAVNDLWVHIEAVKKLESVPGANDAGPGIEMSKLRDSIEKRRQMFQALSDVMRSISESQKNITSNLR